MEYYNHQLKAFKYEDGQFICHTYASLPSNEKQTLVSISSLFCTHQNSLNPQWEFISDESIHVTILRGHRAIYYHQINSLTHSLSQACDNIQPFGICLDKLKIFSNHERTRQFVCMVESTSNEKLTNAKKKIQQAVDKFALKLSDEDETNDTSSHCSFLSRRIKESCQLDTEVEEESLRQICVKYSKLREEPICYIHIDTIHIRIGKMVYDFRLNGVDVDS